MELRTDKIRACFDRKIGNFTELWNLSTNTNYVRCAPRDPLIELWLEERRTGQTVGAYF